jgi:hypothetical protein
MQLNRRKRIDAPVSPWGSGRFNASEPFSTICCYSDCGKVGVMTGFHKEGPVDFAWIIYSSRANTSHGLLLVNGEPCLVNLEDSQAARR